MTHSEIKLDIPAYVAAQLDQASRARLEEHLAACTECEDLVRCCEELAIAVRRDAGAGWTDEPEPLQLREYALGAAVENREQIARHVEQCASCALEVATWTRAKAPGVVVAGPWRRLPSLAAGALLGAAASLLVFVSLRGNPEAARAWSGVAQPLLVDGASRSGAALSVRSAPTQPYVPLSVRVSLPEDTGEDTRLRFTVSPVGGSVSWQEELTAARVREEQGRTWVIGFLLPTESHPPGRYVLQVVPAEPSGADALLEVPFEIVR